VRGRGGEVYPNRLLLVDDDPHVCSSLKRILLSDGYEITTAHGADEAHAALRGRPIDVVISDQRMPGKTGTQFLAEVMALYPRTVRLILSGAAEAGDVAQALRSGAICKYLAKPIDAGLLRANVAEAFARAASLPAAGDAAAACDALTGLPSRAHVSRLLPRLAVTAHASGEAICVLLLRVEQYPAVVASFGRAAGDAFLRAVAKLLARAFGLPYLVCHDAPGDFAVVATDADPGRRIRRIGAVLDDAFASPVRVAGQNIRVTFSLGAAIGTRADANYEELVDQATAAMAASAGADTTIQVYEQTLVTMLRGRLQLETDLRDAVASRRFELAYQPQVDVTAGRIVGLEALARWRHAECGLVSPLEFIPLAEKLDLIGELGRWILATAVGQMAELRSRGIAPREIAVNVSPRQLQRPAIFLSQVEDLLGRHGLPATALVIEITESAAIERERSIGDCLHELGSLGVTLAIDDFGTGYANLRNLTRFPFKKLKLDRSLLPSSADERSRRLYASVVSMAHELGLAVVAEGIETPEDLAIVEATGCRVVQGYLYSPPVKAEHLDALLARGGGSGGERRPLRS
jgi:diguanylate cyclase (GGDEF)-like protein